MPKVVINTCFGGFSVSRAAFHRLRELGQKEAIDEPDIGEAWSGTKYIRKPYLDGFCSSISRDDPLLLRVVEELGDLSHGPHAKLRVVEVPDGVAWEIDDYDGNETVAEKHRTWR